MLENCTPEDAINVAEKIRSAVVDFSFAWDGEYRIGTSIGLVEFEDDSHSVDDLIELADIMCYVAQDSGRNRVAIRDAAGDRPGARRGEGEAP